MLVTFILFLFVLYRIFPSYLTPIIAIVFSGTFFNFWHGQNGFLFTSLLGGGLLLLDSYPVVAGILFGFLACKPHLAILVPFALLAGRRWMTLYSMIATATIITIASLIIFGWQAWIAFFNNAPFAKEMLEKRIAPWNIVFTPFATLKMLGFSNSVAYTGQFITASLSIVIVCYFWHCKYEPAIQNSILVLGTLFFSPYVFVYDSTLLLIPIAYMIWMGCTTEWLHGELAILFLTLAMPFLAVMIGLKTKIQIAPFVLLALFLFMIRRLIYMDNIGWVISAKYKDSGKIDLGNINPGTN
jgi:alpha-1,2-mannosyltransferase